jgi:ABC-type transporter MlaC component
VRAERKKLYKIAKDEQHRNFFKHVRNRIIEGNYQGKLLTFKPNISHIVPERKALTNLKFKN